MGQSIARTVLASDGLELAGVWVRSDRPARRAGPHLLRDLDLNTNLETLVAASDVAIDFTLPGATRQVLQAALKAGTPLVCGVSGLDSRQMDGIREAAQSIPVLYDRNMSLGVAVLTELVRQAAQSLGEGYAATVAETHHVHKKDAPSGTALQLGAALARARNQDFDEHYRYAPDDTSPRRTPQDIVFTVERRGEVAGDHSVCFASDLEQLILRHTVSDRRVFAEGALRAGRWLVRQAPGLYAMRDVVHAGDRVPVSVT
jgi:4-hydroxy-tetrahydrodipicolinate reductase